jgi:hypothetical protein
MRDFYVKMLIVFAAKRNTLVAWKYAARMSFEKELPRPGDNHGRTCRESLQ